MRRFAFLFGLLTAVVASTASAQTPCSAGVEGPSGSTYVSSGYNGGAVGRGVWSIKADGLVVNFSQESISGRYGSTGGVSVSAKLQLAARPAPETATIRMTLDGGRSLTKADLTLGRFREGQAEYWTYAPKVGDWSGLLDPRFTEGDFAASKTVTVTLESDGKVVLGPWVVPLDHADRDDQLARAWKAIETQRTDGGCRASGITRPDWVRKPSGDALQKVYPPAAKAAGKSGRAILSCAVTAQGTLEACSVVSETDGGFGAAALKLAPMFKMKPTIPDGTPVTGAQVRIPIAFMAPDL